MRTVALKIMNLSVAGYGSLMTTLHEEETIPCQFVGERIIWG